MVGKILSYTDNTHSFSSGAFRGVVFGGAIAPILSATGVTPTLSFPPPAVFNVTDFLVN